MEYGVGVIALWRLKNASLDYFLSIQCNSSIQVQIASPRYFYIKRFCWMDILLGDYQFKLRGWRISD